MPIDNKKNNLSILTELDSSTDAPYKMTEFDDGSVDFEFDLDEEPLDPLLDSEHFENLTEYMDDNELAKIARIVIEGYEEDKESRAEWLSTVSSGLNLLGAKLEEATDPFPGACGAHHPLILESAVKFQAKASNELFDPKGPVKTSILGKPTPEMESKAIRVKNHMNYQLMEQMEEYFDETELMLFYLPIIGSSFKKMFFDRLKNRPMCEFVPVDQFVVNYHTSNLNSALRWTHKIYRNGNDLKKDMVSGVYRETQVGIAAMPNVEEVTGKIDELMGFSPVVETETYELLEQAVYLNLPGKHSDKDDIAHPYLVTVEVGSQKVLSIRRNWKEEDEFKKPICLFTHYKFVPGMGFYGLGYVHLLGNLQMTLTSSLRSLVDSGTFANLQAGFVDKRLRIRSKDGPLAPGEFKEVEAGGVELDKAIKLIPFKEPSQTLFALYQFIEARAQKFADTTEQVIADSTNYGPVGTTLALLEASTKFFSGVHKRLHNTQKQEFKILAGINYDYLEDSQEYTVVNAVFEIQREDYNGDIKVIPVSDPNMASQAQRLTISQAIYTAALQNPAIHDLYEISKYYYNSIGLPEAYVDKFLPPKEDAKNSDPVTDIIDAQAGKPIKAFQGQDHDSHIAIKTAFLQDPSAGGNLMMQNVIPKIQANIQEHVILKFQESLSGMVGDTNQMMDQKVVAQAAEKLAEQNKKLAELQMIGPDEAKSKLANAELLRAINEGKKIETDMMIDQAEMSLKALQIEMDRIKEENKMMLAGLQEENKKNQAEMKTTSDLVKQILKMVGDNTKTQIQSKNKSVKTNEPV